MEKTAAQALYNFFLEYYDDHVTEPCESGRVLMNARTLRVLSRIYGRPPLKQLVHQWERDGDVVVLADWESVDGDTASVEMFHYVREKSSRRTRPKAIPN